MSFLFSESLFALTNWTFITSYTLNITTSAAYGVRGRCTGYEVAVRTGYEREGSSEG